MSAPKNIYFFQALVQFARWLKARRQFYRTRREMPWRLRPVRNFVIALIANPRAALKYARRYLIIKNMSFPCFRLQVFGPRLLKETMNICRQVDIHPFLSYGSLLGYFRERALIDTDNDIDLGLLENEAHKLPLLKKAMVAQGYRIRIDTELELSFRKKRFDGIYIDFWIHRIHQASKTIYSGCLFADRRDEKVSIFPFAPDIFARMKKVKFLGVDVFIPHQPERYLLKTYGKDWRIPFNREYTFQEKTKFIYPHRLKISKEEYYRGDFL